MKRSCSVVLLVLLSAFFLKPADASTVIFQDDFEGYTASTSWPSADDADPGTPPVGDDWWVSEPDAPRVQVQSEEAGINSCAGPHGGSNYLQSWLLSTQAAAMIPSAGQDLIEQNQNATLDMWVYKNLADGWDGLLTIGGYDSSPGGAQGGRSFLLYFRADGKLQYFDGALKDTGVTFTSDKWLHLVLEADFSDFTYDVTLDGQTATDLSFHLPVTKLQNVILSGSTDVSGNFRGAFDDIVVSVDVVPEPGTLALLGIVLCGLLTYSWRKRGQ